MDGSYPERDATNARPPALDSATREALENTGLSRYGRREAGVVPSAGLFGSSHEGGSKRTRDLNRVCGCDVAVVPVGHRVTDHGRAAALEAEEAARGDESDPQAPDRCGDAVVGTKGCRRPRRRASRHRRV